jgi:transposase
LVLHVRGICKATGSRLPSGSVDAFHQRARAHLPSELVPALAPVLDTLEHLTSTIKGIEKELATLAERDYPETQLLQQVPGVGPLTSLAFILTIEHPARFEKSREVGPYLGLTPGQRQSGDRDVATGITKQGDAYLRRLLVQCAHHILHKGPDSDLKRVGVRLKERGAHTNKAVTAVARKLAVLLHHLWVTGEVYEPLHHHASCERDAMTA